MLAIGVWSEMPVDGWFVLAYSFVLSRALYGVSILAIKHAKESKCSIYVPQGRLKIIEIGIMLLYIAFCVKGMISLNPAAGSYCIAGAVVAFLLSMYVAHRNFGGVTEDTAGFFVQICEVLMPLAALIAYKQWW